MRSSEAVRAALVRAVVERGEAAAVAQLGIHRATFARLYGGLPVQAGTLLLAATRLGVKLAGTLADPPPGPSDEAAGG